MFGIVDWCLLLSLIHCVGVLCTGSVLSLFDPVVDVANFAPELRSMDSEYPPCELARGSGILAGICVPPKYYQGGTSISSTNSSSTSNVDDNQDKQSASAAAATSAFGLLPFCGEYVNYPACVPPRIPLWPSWHAAAKDKVIETMFTKIINDRVAREILADDNAAAATTTTTTAGKGSTTGRTNNNNSSSNDINDGSGDGFIDIRFAQSIPCVSALKKALCMFNFPKCDIFMPFPGVPPSTTFPLCRSECLNFFSQCGYGSDVGVSICGSGSGEDNAVVVRNISEFYGSNINNVPIPITSDAAIIISSSTWPATSEDAVLERLPNPATVALTNLKPPFCTGLARGRTNYKSSHARLMMLLLLSITALYMLDFYFN